MAEKKIRKCYRLLRGSAAAVEREADALMQAGWTPLGPPFTSRRQIREGMYGWATEVFQALTRSKGDKETLA